MDDLWVCVVNTLQAYYNKLQYRHHHHHCSQSIRLRLFYGSAWFDKSPPHTSVIGLFPCKKCFDCVTCGFTVYGKAGIQNPEPEKETEPEPEPEPELEPDFKLRPG